jgi:hypothetical protein
VVGTERPEGHTQEDGRFVCPHRDLSRCPACARHPHLVEVSGVYFYVPDAAERAAFAAELAAGFAEN